MLRVIAAWLGASLGCNPEQALNNAVDLLSGVLASGCPVPTAEDLERFNRDRKIYALRGTGIPALKERFHLSRSQLHEIIRRQRLGHKHAA